MNDVSYKLFFKAVANKTRCDIVGLLRKNPKSVTQLCQELGFEQSRVSHNLKCLVRCGFVNCAYMGKSRVYSLDSEIADILGAIDHHMRKYQGRLRTCGILERKHAVGRKK